MPSLGELDPDLQGPATDLYNLAVSNGLSPQITSTLRSITKQATLYERYIHGHWPYPVAPPGRSAHNYGWAFDMTVTPYEALSDLGAIWADWGGTWGASADPVHFELPGASAWLKTASYADIVGALSTAYNQPADTVAGWLGSWLGLPSRWPELIGTDVSNVDLVRSFIP